MPRFFKLNVSTEEIIASVRQLKSEAKETIIKVFEQYKDDYEDFEGTMSYFYEIMKGDEFVSKYKTDDERFVHIIFKNNVLSDREINELLKEYGDDEYFACRHGELVSLDNEIFITTPDEEYVHLQFSTFVPDDPENVCIDITVYDKEGNEIDGGILEISHHDSLSEHIEDSYEFIMDKSLEENYTFINEEEFEEIIEKDALGIE